jgi:tetratricopeptide (TPR) repeat protein
MTSTSFAACPELRIENNAFISPLIHHVLVHAHAGEPYTVRSNIFGENTRGKAHIPFAGIGRSESNNCFYTRWAEQDRKVIGTYRGGMTLPEYRAVVRETDSVAANPQMPGARGFRQGWGPALATKDFHGLFAANPLVVSRGIGLQPEAFGDFHFCQDKWPYDKAWAGKILAQLRATEALVKAGKDAEALAAYAKLAEQTPMEDRLKSDVLERAALCADRLNNYEKAMELAKRISLKPLSSRRQMALMAKRGRFAELLEAFADRPGQGTPHLSWFCPETEMLLADALYYRAIAYAETGDLNAAERELRTMVDKGRKLGYSPGATVLDLCWKRLGDFYRDRLKDDAKALEAYRHVISRTTVFHHDRPMPKPVLSGASEVLVAATEAACEILRRQGKDREAGRLRRALVEAQAEARAFLENSPRPWR